MHISYGQAMALLKSLAITFLSISYAFAKALYVFGLMFAGQKGRTTAILTTASHQLVGIQ